MYQSLQHLFNLAGLRKSPSFLQINESVKAHKIPNHDGWGIIGASSQPRTNVPHLAQALFEIPRTEMQWVGLPLHFPIYKMNQIKLSAQIKNSIHFVSQYNNFKST